MTVRAFALRFVDFASALAPHVVLALFGGLFAAVSGIFTDGRLILDAGLAHAGHGGGCSRFSLPCLLLLFAVVVSVLSVSLDSTHRTRQATA